MIPAQLGGLGVPDGLGASTGAIGPLLWLTVGILTGFALTVALAGSSSGINNMLLRQILRGNKDGWVFVQRGKTYALEPLERDDDTDAWTTKHDDEEETEWLTDPADKLHTWHGVPIGLALEGQRPMVDVETTAAAEGAAQKTTDGGQLQATEQFSLEELQEQLVVGDLTLQQEGAGSTVVRYINPFTDLPREQFVDLRPITKLLRYDAGSDIPRKAAKNATEAEQALDGGTSDLWEFGKAAGYIMIGAICTYIGVTGGGGGGGTSVGLMIAAMGVL